MPNPDFSKLGEVQSAVVSGKGSQISEEPTQQNSSGFSLDDLGLKGIGSSGAETTTPEGSTFTITVNDNTFELQKTGPKQEDIEWLQSCLIQSASDLGRARTIINNLNQTDPFSGILKGGKKVTAVQHWWALAVLSMDRDFKAAQKDWLEKGGIEQFLAYGQ